MVTLTNRLVEAATEAILLNREIGLVVMLYLLRLIDACE